LFVPDKDHPAPSATENIHSPSETVFIVVTTASFMLGLLHNTLPSSFAPEARDPSPELPGSTTQNSDVSPDQTGFVCISPSVKSSITWQNVKTGIKTQKTIINIVCNFIIICFNANSFLLISAMT